MSELIAYTVMATLPDAATRDEYTHWLTSGHMREVVAAGAVSAAIVVVTDPAAPIRVEARYVFASRVALDEYVRDHAPRLRAEGLAKFGAERGIGFERRVGEYVEVARRGG